MQVALKAKLTRWVIAHYRRLYEESQRVPMWALLNILLNAWVILWAFLVTFGMLTGVLQVTVHH